MIEYKVTYKIYNRVTMNYEIESDSELVDAETSEQAIELIKQYLFDSGHDNYFNDREITENSVIVGDYEYTDFESIRENETPQDRWQRKAGYISKSYKLKKELVDEFKDVCESRGRKQAEVLTELMNEFIKNN